MKSTTTLSQLQAGDRVALLNLFGRRLAVVREVSREGFSVGIRQYHWDGRGRNHADSVAVLPVADDLNFDAGRLLPESSGSPAVRSRSVSRNAAFAAGVA